MAWFWTKDGTPLHYIDRGAGRPVILIHALMYSARYFWKPQIAPLAEGCRVLALDMRWHGESGKPLGPYSIDRLGDDLDELITGLNLRDAVVLGVALGGMVVLNRLRRHGAGGVKAIAICDMTPRLTNAPGWEHPTFGSFPPEAAAGFGAGVRADRTGLKGFIATGFAAPPSEAALNDMYAESFLVPTDAVADLCDDMVKQDLRAQLPTIPVPTLYMYATAHNKILPTAVGRWMQSQTPGSRLVEFGQGGHNFTLEEPDKFNRELLAFVNSLPA
jgi:pimeloyl-ACP methyl ester carboxylesterase